MKPEKDSLQYDILSLVQRKKTLPYTALVEILEKELTKSTTAKTKIKYRIQKTVKQLIDSNLLEELHTDHSMFLRITASGRQRLRSLRLDKPSPIPLLWDGKWRIVLLDVPESKKDVRNALRYILKKAGFMCLKNAVWVSPFPLEHMLTQMKEDLTLTTELMIFVTSELDPITESYIQKEFAKK